MPSFVNAVMVEEVVFDDEVPVAVSHQSAVIIAPIDLAT